MSTCVAYFETTIDKREVLFAVNRIDALRKLYLFIL